MWNFGFLLVFFTGVCAATWPWPSMGGGNGGSGGSGGSGSGGSGGNPPSNTLYGHCHMDPNAAKMDASHAVDGLTVRGMVDMMGGHYGETTIRIFLSGLNPSSTHGFHIHQFGDLSNGCESAMSHYNPFDQMHGAPNDQERHVGDLGNVDSDVDGQVLAEMVDPKVNLGGPFSVLGRTIVVHEKADDLGLGGDEESTKTGNAGTRLACCVIGTANGTSWENNPAGMMTTLLRKRNFSWQDFLNFAS